MNLALLALLLGQVISTPPGVNLQDEGINQGRIQTVNCTGAGVTCSTSGIVGTVNVPGGGAGSANVVAVTVDFTSGGLDGVKTIVVGQPWITASSVIVCSPTLLATATRAEGAEDAVIEGLTVGVSDRIAGVGFTLATWARVGKAYGQFIVHCTGA